MSEDFLKADGLSFDQRARVLEIGYKQISKELQHTEDMEHKAAIAVSSLVILLAGFVVQSAHDPGRDVRALLAFFCIVFSALAAYFIQMNRERKFLLFRDLIRVEEILGFFEPENYISEEVVKKRGQKTAHQESTVFDTAGLLSGKKSPNRSSLVHALAVILTGVVASLAVLVD